MSIVRRFFPAASSRLPGRSRDCRLAEAPGSAQLPR